jgi:hypothetical protein
MDGWKLGLAPSMVVTPTASGYGAGPRSQAGGPRANPGLVGTPATLARECAPAAERAGFPIACPVALPRGSDPFWGNGFSRGECEPRTLGTMRLRRWTWVGAYFPIGAGFGHVVVASAPRVIDPSSFIYLVGTAKPHPSRRVMLAGETTVRGHAANYVHPSLNPRFDPPPRVGGIVFMGRTVLIWSENGHTYAIGIAGRRIDAQSVEAAIAHRLTLAMP